MHARHVLITGGSGFLGSSIVRRLLAADPSVLVTILDQKTPAEVLEEFPGRIRHDERSISEFLAAPRDWQFETIVHMAWASHPATSMKFPVQDLDANVSLGIRLLESCARLGARRLIFSSSGGTVYGELNCERASEIHPTNPVSIYGAAKLAFESYGQVIGRRDGFDVVSLRIANPYGPYQLRGVPVGSIANFLLAAREDRPITLFGDGSIVRDYISVDDVAEAFCLAARVPDLAPGPYNISTGIGSSLTQIIELVEQVSGRELMVDRQPNRGFDVPRNVLEWNLFGSATGWRPTTSLNKGVATMWDFLK